MLSERSLIDPKETLLIQWLKKVGVDDFTLRPMLCLGFLAVGIYEHHRWYSVPSADRNKYGDFPLIVLLYRGLNDPWMLVSVQSIALFALCAASPPCTAFLTRV